MNRPIRSAIAFGIALTAALLAAPAVAAQGRSAEDAQIIDGYRLTMPVLRKVLPALHAPGAERCPRDGRRDPHALGIADMVQRLEGCAPAARALRRAGVPLRDAAIVFASLLRTAKEVALHSGKASDIAPGVLRDNGLLVQQNEAEIKRLTTNGASS